MCDSDKLIELQAELIGATIIFSGAARALHHARVTYAEAEIALHRAVDEYQGITDREFYVRKTDVVG